MRKSKSRRRRRISSMRRRNGGGNIRENPINLILLDLGFDEDDLEYYDYATDADKNRLIDMYLEMARQPPYNQSWNTVDDATNANYILNTANQFGRQYNKHDIANAVFSEIYHPLTNGGKKYRKRRRTRKRKY